MKYIDVSYAQGVIDWAQVKAAEKISGVIIRAGYGQNNIDDYFVRNISECNRLGIPCGVYWMSYALSPEMARKEAEYCLAAIAPYRVELPVCFDFEDASVAWAQTQHVLITKALASSFVEAFCSTIEHAGYYAVNYASPNFLSNYFDAATTRRWTLWLAWYTTKDHYAMSYEPGLWQYTDAASVPGIRGHVDMSEVYYDYAAIIAERGLNRLPSEPQPWYAAAQAWAVQTGIADGTRPEEPATRAEVWTMLQRLAQK